MIKVENWFFFMVFDMCIKYVVEYFSVYCVIEWLINLYYVIVFINRRYRWWNNEYIVKLDMFVNWLIIKD